MSALKWKDHDTDRSVLRIRRPVCDGELVPFTKTEKARVVGVPQILAEALRQHREAVEAEGVSTEPDDLMFPSCVGTSPRSGRISDALRKACKLAGIRILRATFLGVSHRVNAGVIRHKSRKRPARHPCLTGLNLTLQRQL